MKKVLFIAALGVAGLMTANSNSEIKTNTLKTENYSSKVTLFRGTCTFSIYRTNPNGSQTLVYSNTSQTDTPEQCWALRDKKLQQAFDEQW